MEQLPLFPEYEDPPVLAGVKILLERMEKFPEEFSLSGSRWGWVETFFTASALNPLTEYEKNALMNGLRKAHRELFTAQVLRVLSGKDGDPDTAKGAMFTHSNSFSGVTLPKTKMRMKS